MSPEQTPEPKQAASAPPKSPSEMRRERLERDKQFLAGRQADLKREAAERQAQRQQ